MRAPHSAPSVSVALILSLAALSSACGDSGTGGSGGAGGGSGGASDGGAGGAASSGGGGAGGGSSDPGALEADYCAPLAELVCARAGDCGCEVIVPSGNFDEALCAAAYTERCLEAYAPLADAVTLGLASIDAGRAAECIDLLTTLTPGCERPRGTVTFGLCPAWFSSDVALGEPCSFPLCAGGAGFCDGGTCAPRPVAGESCEGLECVPGALCIDGACTLPGASGAACVVDDECGPPLRCVSGECAALLDEGGSCDDASACELGLVCDQTCAQAPPPPCDGDASCGNLSLCANVPVCAARLGLGEPCTSSEACEVGLACDTDATSTCVALPGDGAPCFQGSLCAPGLACASDFGDCAPLPGDGEPCGFGLMGPTLCEAGLGCLAGTCGALPGEGAECTTDSRCAGELGCDFTANGSFCVTKKAAGGECQNDLVCQDGLHCDYSVGACAADYALGEGCSAGNECGPTATCMPGDGGGFVCAALPGVGQACAFECDANLVCAAQPDNAVCVPSICQEL